MSSPSSPVEPRYEVKMVCEERARAMVVARLRLLAAGIRELHPPRRVQSVYFDTHEGRALVANLWGISAREKIRLRWYGGGATGVRGQLERKQRENMLGSKETLVLPRPIDVEGQGRGRFMRALGAQATPAWVERLAGLEPAQWIRYERSYLTTADLAVRITVDHDLTAFDLRLGAKISSARATPLPRLLVVECKASLEHGARLQELVQELPLMSDKCSKFVLASAPEHGPIVSRFGW